MPIRAGAAEVNITPPVGFPLAGYGNREKASDGVHDELYAKALVLEDGKRMTALVTTDLIGLRANRVAQIRRLVRRKTGIPGRHVTVCASHTHFGPALERLPYLPAEAQAEFHESYVQNLVRLIAGAVQVAEASCREAKMAYGSGSAPNLVFNRRPRKADGKVEMSWRPPKPDKAAHLTFGPVDPQVGVLRLDGTDGVPIATLLNFACHPVSGVDKLYSISADYPAYAMKVVEAATGGICLFALGCAGNMVPMEREGAARMRIGTALGGEALKVFESMTLESEASLKVRNAKVELPLRPLPTLDDARAQVDEAKRRLAEWDDSKSPPEEIRTPKGDLLHAEHILRLAEEAGGRKTVTTELQALRIGGMALVCLPGEVFAEIGFAIKQAHPNAFVLSLCNDSLDYVPVAASYDEGGYEPEWTKLGRGAGETLLDAALGLAQACS
jgi:hypothetical protein